MYDVNAALVERIGERAIMRVQEIPDDFLQDLEDARDASAAPAGEMHRVGSIPVYLVEHWQRQGFDVFKEPITATVARLKREGLDYFLATTKAV